jgi:hypothetical protein
MSHSIGEHVAGVTCKLPFLRKDLRLHALKLAYNFGLLVHQCVLPTLWFLRLEWTKMKCCQED